MFYEDYSLDILYGGKVQRCWILEIVRWNKHFINLSGIVVTWLEPIYERVWGFRLIYYKVKLLKQLKAQIEQLKIVFYSSGFVSFARGLHFNWCKRWKNYNG